MRPITLHKPCDPLTSGTVKKKKKNKKKNDTVFVRFCLLFCVELDPDDFLHAAAD